MRLNCGCLLLICCESFDYFDCDSVDFFASFERAVSWPRPPIQRNQRRGKRIRRSLPAPFSTSPPPLSPPPPPPVDLAEAVERIRVARIKSVSLNVVLFFLHRPHQLFFIFFIPFHEYRSNTSAWYPFIKVLMNIQYPLHLLGHTPFSHLTACKTDITKTPLVRSIVDLDN